MNLIVAVDKNWAIGFENKLLVRIPDDQKYFREMTTGKVVVMGRKTLESFPNGIPLKNRTNIVITSNPGYKAKDAIVCGSMEETLQLLQQYKKEDIYIIGGESIYRQFLSHCDTAYVTYIDYSYQADTYFPNLERLPEWTVTEESEEQTYFDLEYVYRIYRKK